MITNEKDHSQFNLGRTFPGRWTITFSNPLCETMV